MISLFTIIANKVGVSVALLLSICTVETNLRNVNNYKDHFGGSFGLCQIQDRTARHVAPHIDRLALQQPQVNVEVAALYLKQLNDKYKRLDYTIAAYNAGRVKLVDGKPFNQGYVNKVMKHYKKYDQ